ncbi:MAG: hypothetical protein ACRC33_23315, partial [Gemmataceae bacterium]
FASVTSAAGYWASSALDTFVFKVTGGNTSPQDSDPDAGDLAGDSSRFGERDYNDLVVSTYGSYLTYDLTLTFTGVTGATFDPLTGRYTATSYAGLTGTFTGVFENLSFAGDDPSRDGRYRFDIAVNGGPSDGTLSSAVVVPAPPALALAGSGCALLFGFGLRRLRGRDAGR